MSADIAGIDVVEGPYFHDIQAQPQALKATLDWLERDGRWDGVKRFAASKPWKRIVLTGMGSSYHTLHPVNLALIEAGASPVMIETSELIHYGMALCDADTLVVAVSQSGRSAEMQRLLELNSRAKILAVTNTADSPLAQQADLALLSHAGPEFSVSCKTYVSGMLALQWLAAAMTGKTEDETLAQLSPAAALTGEYLAEWKAHVARIASRLSGAHHLFFTGRGTSLSAVGTGALIIKEAARIHAEGMSSAAFRHGPLEMLQDDMFVMVFSGDGEARALNRRLARELTALSGRCEEIGTGADFAPFRLAQCHAVLMPILEILPVQMITLALVAHSGRQAGNFLHARKITDTE